ncbi:MAG: NUDIX domain-containing protein [Candidatus Paceibacterota bacterium]|jgi:ADP-ribose pyrophosphatase YjhB (NUDIX family)
MEIKSQYEHRGKIYKATYIDGCPSRGGVHSYCFYNDKLVLVSHKKDNNWTPPGGGIEKGETYEEAAIREIKEESNMKVVKMKCIGYIDVEVQGEDKRERQYRMCCIVEPYGDFESDPDNDIFAIKLIDPKEYKEYIKWGEIGDYLMKRALEMKVAFDKELK